MSQITYTPEQIDAIHFDATRALRTAERRTKELMDKVRGAADVLEVGVHVFRDLATMRERVASLRNLVERMDAADQEAMQKQLRGVRTCCQSELLYSDPARTDQDRMRAAQVVMGIFADAEAL